MATDLALNAERMYLDVILEHGVPGGEVLDEFIAELDQQLSDNQIEWVLPASDKMRGTIFV